MLMTVLAVTLTFVLLYYPVTASVDDFTLFFTTNTEEYHEYIVLMTKPLPSWTNGLYIRNGAGRFEMGQRQFTHALDGFAKLHSFRFQQDHVLFSSRFLASHVYNDSLEENDIAPYLLLGSTKPSFGLMDQFMSFVNGVDNTNVNVFKYGVSHDEAFVTVSDYWNLYEIHPYDLHVKRKINPDLPYASALYSYTPIPSSSHPLQEKGSGAYINFYSIMFPLLTQSRSINVVRIHSAEERELIASIPRDSIPYMHCLGLTQYHAVIFAHPAIINFRKLLTGGSPLAAIDWTPELPMDLHVVHLKTGRVYNLQAPSTFVMHFVNGFELNGTLTLDMVTYNDMNFLESFQMADVLSGKLPFTDTTLRRYTIDLGAMMVGVKTFPSRLPLAGKLDMPIINGNYQYKSYCYVYGFVIASEGQGQTQVCLSKKDLCHRGNQDKVWCKDKHIPSEPAFFPRPLAGDEDDGLLMTLVLDVKKQLSYILFLDAESMTEVTAGYLPTWMPLTMHGHFFKGY